MEYLHSVASFLYNQGVLGDDCVDSFLETAEKCGKSNHQSPFLDSNKDGHISFGNKKFNTVFDSNDTIPEADEQFENSKSNYDIFNRDSHSRHKDKSMSDNTVKEKNGHELLLKFEENEQLKMFESPESSIHHDQSDHFEGKIVYALAETLNSMNSSQINQMAERIIQRWKQEEEDAFNSKMKKLIRAYEKSSFMQAQKALSIWRCQSREHTLKPQKPARKEDNCRSFYYNKI